MKTNGPMPLVGGARLPLGFIGFGLVALVTACAWLAWEPSLVLQPHLHPRVVALAHLWLPGFLLSVCFGATYQLTPVVLGEPLAWERVTWGHLGLHAAGVPAMVAGFLTGRMDVAAAGGAAVAMGVILFSANVWVTFARAKRRDAIGWSLPLAGGWLVLTVLGGLLLAAMKLGLSVPVSPLGLLRAHAHAGLAGFFLTLVQGVAFQLVPMFTLGEVRRPWRVAAGLVGTQAGLVGLAGGLVMERSELVWAGAAGIAVGVALSGIELVATLGARRKRRLEPGLKAFVAGAGAVGVSVIVGGVLVWAEPGVAALRGAMGYGVAIIGGAMALMVMGMLCKIVPFLVWMRAYGPKVGRVAVPAAHTLGNAGWERAWLGLHVAGVMALGVGAMMESVVVVSAGAWMLAGGVSFFAMNAARVLGHLRVSNAAGLRLTRPTFL
ncbi:hypothetical protein CMV30_05965 [Nibricoccus aquaticus]|uniref:Cytochrome oxidase subunit I profile domain-containing protein n=1 Tax=Nibricoccus aquaticus TaxID=2576891 RepID=A0A290QBD4_9BACT|nr:hypothetical protein [Nibricoccus aquaticus]ATC63536.1 hypothetical protein CMV30_05965 [Nibricoccus aquaticus]